MNQLSSILENVSGTSFIALDTITTPKLLGGKKNPQQGNIRKVMIGSNVIIFAMKNGSGYENMVKRRLTKEGKDPQSFQLQERTWGKRIPQTPFIEHNGQFYLEVIFLKAGKSHYTLNGQPISKDQIQGLPTTPESGEQGGLDDKVIIRTFAVDSICAITIDGTKHILTS